MLGLIRNALSTRTNQYQKCISSQLIKKYSTETVQKKNEPEAERPAATNLVNNSNINSLLHPTKIKPVTEEEDKLFSRLEIEIKSADPAVLKSYSWFAVTSAQHLGIDVGKCWAQRKAHHDRLTLLKSVHIFKKHRVQYEIRTYFRYMHFHKLTGSTLDTFLEYIERNLPEGVELKATKFEIQSLPDHLKETPESV